MIFINQEAGYLQVDIINAFVAKGYECVLISGKIVALKNPLNKDVRIEKIIKYSRNSIPSRIFTWVVGFFQIWWKVILKYRKDELFIASNPPIVPFLPLIVPNSYYQYVLDLDMHRVLDLKVVKKAKPFYRLWEKQVTKTLSGADGVFTISYGMARILQKNTIGQEVVLMPLWADNSDFKSIEKESNTFIKKHNLQKKFIVMYSGNLGLSSGVEPLLEVAKISTNEDVLFLIVGEGIRKKALVKTKEDYQLDNCMFLPWQEPDVLPYSLASADLAVVSLAGSEANRSIPSKLYNNMGVGTPILGITSRTSDLAEVIHKYDIGRTFEPYEIEEISHFIDTLSRDMEKRNRFGVNSKYAAKNFTSSNINIILDAIQNKKANNLKRETLST